MILEKNVFVFYFIKSLAKIKYANRNYLIAKNVKKKNFHS